jgi:hypothetical protein
MSADALPKGLSMQVEHMADMVDTVPVVFEATPDAPLGAVLTSFTAQHVDAKQKIPCEFRQSAELIIGPPNFSVYWKHEVDRAAVAVTEEAPFKIEIVEPKVPLVRNGLMSLKVLAQRKPGFKAPIAVSLIWNPPGVGSGGLTIPEGQNEALLPMNANSAAPIRKWKIVAIGVATVGDGPLWVSSQLATLEIAPPFASLSMERAAAEQGKETEIFCKVQNLTPFTGPAHVRLLGLPNPVTAPVVDVAAETKEFAFRVAVPKTSPAGTHRNIFCEFVVTKNGEPIVHYLGGTELRVDVPLPVKPAEAAKPQQVTVAKPAVTEAPKRLSRLEKLRQEQEEREKAAKTGQPK